MIDAFGAFVLNLCVHTLRIYFICIHFAVVFFPEEFFFLSRCGLVFSFYYSSRACHWSFWWQNTKINVKSTETVVRMIEWPVMSLLLCYVMSVYILYQTHFSPSHSLSLSLSRLDSSFPAFSSREHLKPKQVSWSSVWVVFNADTKRMEMIDGDSKANSKMN